MGLSLLFFSFRCLILWLLFLYFSVLVRFTCCVQSLCHENERFALLQFKESMIINKFASSEPSAYPKVASWKANTNCCSWDEVTCNEVSGHLVELDLSSSCLYGSINFSSSLFHLVHLTRLSLADNDFNGSKIPSTIKNLSKLSYLSLYNSSFSGQIPLEVLELSKLEILDTTFNFNLKLQNPSLRSLLENLTQLKQLYLGHSNISSPIPDILANLSSLTTLSLKGCQLQGEFPAKIFQLPNLQILSVRFNPNLSGSLPKFQNNSPLEELRVANTTFFGEIPYSIGSLNSLQILDVSSCLFFGLIPPSLGNLSSLKELDLSMNYFSSQDSHSLSWMGQYSELTYLGLAGINLVGEITSWVTTLKNLTKITHLFFNDNKFSGKLPATLGNLSSLEELDLSMNNFSSYDSHSLSWMANSKLTFLSLLKTNLVGEFPSWVMSLKSLTRLYLSQNELNGIIPSQIRNLTQLKNLALDSNQFQGLFPSALYHLESLELLYLDSNILNGTVDMDMIAFKFRNLKYFSLSSNNFSLLIVTNGYTEFPKFSHLGLGSCNLNKFPSFLRNQDQLTDLDLSSNKIAGKIPRWFLNAGYVPKSITSCTFRFNENLASKQVYDDWNLGLGEGVAVSQGEIIVADV
ncbi:receptor-like protein 7 [Mangifera indica]|uniref:receptor-like protein 7 n=1 Tax=Mangifera indica TaxID=29780 RepID=UPI001CFBA057|nr:receptor-like protein 7 [Mangifera indica]